ncbi:hypothetical protein GCM10029992_31880 [Glycomyces albus]
MAENLRIIGDTLPGVDMNAPLLEVEDLRIEFKIRGKRVPAVRGANFTLETGRTLAIVGESGSGKSVTSQAVMGILDSPPGYITGGAVRLHGVDILQQDEETKRSIRSNHIGMVFQDALSALNPCGRSASRSASCSASTAAPAARRPRSRPANCSTWSASPTRRTASATTRTSSPGACARGS